MRRPCASTLRLALLSGLVITPLAACGDDPPPAIDVGACAHLEMGPYQPVTAVGARDISTPTVATDHKAYTVTLTASGIGYTKLEVTAAGEHTIFLDRDLALTVLEGAGTPAKAGASATSSPSCTTVMARRAYTLGQGTAYVGLATDNGAAVNMVIETADGHAAD